jgi:hypothetical protein
MKSRVRRLRDWLSQLGALQKWVVGIVAIGVALTTAGSAAYGAWTRFDGRYLKVAAGEQMQKQIEQKVQGVDKKVDNVQLLILQQRLRDVKRRIRDWEEMALKRPLSRTDREAVDDLREEQLQVERAIEKLR